MTLARYLCLAAPLALTLLASRFTGRRDRQARRAALGAALLSFIAALVGLAGLQEAARWAGWWLFAPVEGAFRGTPVDLWIGWAALWGPAPVLVRRVLPVPLALGSLLWLDVVAMPALHPLVQLGPNWLVGEGLGLLTVALPAQLLGRWSAERRHLGARVLLQITVVAALTLWLIPTVAFEVGDGSWARLTGLSPSWLFVSGQLGLLSATPALLAVREFAVSGGGTPYPWDPPKRLITTGPYAYVANPMQLSAVALLLLLAVLTGSVTLALAAVVGTAFSAAVARPHEEHDLRHRYGQQWQLYRSQVSAWWPRWTPYPSGDPAALWLDENCGACRTVRDFLRRRTAHQLILAAAGDHHPPLRGPGTWAAMATAPRGWPLSRTGWSMSTWAGLTWAGCCACQGSVGSLRW